MDHAISAFEADRASGSTKPSFVYLALGIAHAPIQARYPAKLKELQALRWAEARKYSNQPLSEPAKMLRALRRFDDDLPSPPKSAAAPKAPVAE